MDICIAIALTTTVLLHVPGSVTLDWQHSVEHFQIEEDWLATPGGLVLREVRTEGLGAGVHVPDDARRVGRQWRFTPAMAPQPRVVLANSRFAAGYRACWSGQCTRLSTLRGASDRPLVMQACDAGAE